MNAARSEKMINDHEKRLSKAEESLITMKESLVIVENSIGKLDTKLDAYFLALNAKIYSQFKWIMRIIIAGFIIPAFLKIFHLL